MSDDYLGRPGSPTSYHRPQIPLVMPNPGWSKVDLRDRVAVVTGATRGVGKGIAEVLGECGATVYVTGRSTMQGNRTEGLPGSVEETAALVTKAGGRGIDIVSDHTIDAQVEALFRRIEEEQGRLDLLVNNVWGGYERYAESAFEAPFWTQPLWRWEPMFQSGLRAHFTASRFAVPLMLKRKKGLIVSTSSGDGSKYRGNLPYDVAKAALERMVWGMARELRPHGIAAVAVQPGFARTERVLAHFGGDASHPELVATHSPQFAGRAVAMLAAEPRLMKLSGQTVKVGDLAALYGFTDVDGRRVLPFRLPNSYA